MIGDTLSVTLDGTAYVLNKINQDNFTARYYLNVGSKELTFNIRHAWETAKAGQARPFERHQCEFIYTELGATADLDKTYTASTVIRLQKAASPDMAEKVALTLCGTLSAVLVDKVVGWQS